MKTILFVCDAGAKFRVLIDLAEFISKQKGYKSLFYFDDYDGEIKNEPEICEAKNIAYSFSFRSAKAGINEKKQRNLIVRSFRHLIFRFRKHLRIFYKIQECLEYTELASGFLKVNEIKAIVNCEDNYGISPILIKAAEKNKITSILIPFTIANEEEMGFSFYTRNKNQVSGIFMKLFFFLFKKWKLSYKGKLFYYLPPGEIIVQKICGIAPGNPFLSVGGKSKLRLFESDFMKDYYLHSGLKNNKGNIVTGSLKMDVFSNLMKDSITNKEALLNSIGLKEHKPIILCALPPDYYPTPIYKNHKELAEDWLKILSEISSHYIFISLHPRTKPESVAYARNYNVHIINQPIEYLIPLCNIFVASISATIRYALACGKSVVNFDMFDMNYTEYVNEPSVKTVYSREDFLKTIKSLIADPSIGFSKNEYYGKLDGKCGSRIMEVISTI